MAGRRSVPAAGMACLALATLLAAAPRLSAQKLGEFRFELQGDGTPRFTQVLDWKGDPNALYYELSLQALSDGETSTTRIEKPPLELHLAPGEYRYRLTLYNLLGKGEVELPWRTMTVLKAEMPRVTGLARNAWYIEDLVPVVELAGEHLEPGATITLQDPRSPGRSVIGKELERKGSGALSVGFPEREAYAGEYDLVVTNPGGLSQLVPGALAVRYQRPFDLAISAGFAPWVSLYDSWYAEAWPGAFFPVGATSRLALYFAKGRMGYLGAELGFGGRLMDGGSDAATIDSRIGLAGIGCVYKYPFSKSIAAALRLGGGVQLSSLAFDYEGTQGTDISSADPYITAGLSLQYFPAKKWFLELGTDWMNVFAVDFTEGGLMPFLSTGLVL